MIEVIRPYLQARMKTLGYREIASAAYDAKNIEGKTDLAYHVELGQGTSDFSGMGDLKMTTQVTLRCHYDGGAKPKINAVDRAASESTRIINEVMKPMFRLNTDGLKTIYQTGHLIAPLDAVSNQDVFVLTLTFDAITYLAPQN